VIDLHLLRPSQPRIFILWQLFLDNVDPLLKIIHVPTMQRQIHRLVKTPKLFRPL
jgi:hypothetical protein